MADPERRPLPDHGTRPRYNHRTDPCRCELCRAANAAYGATWRARRSPTRRVVQLVIPGVPR